MNFDDICRDYFPHWRNAHLWQVKEGNRAHWIDAQGEGTYSTEHGYCDIPQRIIWVADANNATLIHEICHAITGPYHGKRFQARMRQAAQQAERLGDMALAATLMKEAEGYEPGCLSARDPMKQNKQQDGFDLALEAFLQQHPAHRQGFEYLALKDGKPREMILAFEAGKCFIAWLRQNYPLKDPKKEPNALSFIYQLMHTRQALLIGEMNRGRMHGKHTTP